MFLGTFTPKLLGNSQIVLPAKLRGTLLSDKAILTTGFEKCIYGFSLTDWERIAKDELSKPLSSDEGRKIRRAMFAQASEISLDSLGRFVLAENLRRYAGITTEMVIIGAGDHFEIWDKNEWTQIGNEFTQKPMDQIG